MTIDVFDNLLEFLFFLIIGQTTVKIFCSFEKIENNSLLLTSI